MPRMNGIPGNVGFGSVGTVGTGGRAGLGNVGIVGIGGVIAARASNRWHMLVLKKMRIVMGKKIVFDAMIDQVHVCWG